MGDLDEAVSGAVERGDDPRLNSAIAILVALAATCMALGNIKDGNIGQAMSQAQNQTVDTWSYYQAKSTKQNLAEATRDQLQALRATGSFSAAAAADLDKRIANYEAQVARYEKRRRRSRRRRKVINISTRS